MFRTGRMHAKLDELHNTKLKTGRTFIKLSLFQGSEISFILPLPFLTSLVRAVFDRVPLWLIILNKLES